MVSSCMMLQTRVSGIGKYILIGRQSVARTTRRRKRLDFMLSRVTRAERQAAKISGARLFIK